MFVLSVQFGSDQYSSDNAGDNLIIRRRDTAKSLTYSNTVMTVINVRTQQAHDVETPSYQRRCDVTSHRRWYNVVLSLFACVVDDQLGHGGDSDKIMPQGCAILIYASHCNACYI